MKRISCILFSILCSCYTSSAWKLEAISAGEKSFNSARLKYVPTTNQSPLHFEMTRVGDQIEAYLNLVRYHFSTSKENSLLVKTIFTIDGNSKEEWIPLLEGSMRLRIPSETTQEIIEALQKGQEIGILVDDFEQTLSPEFFSQFYKQLTGSTIFFQNPIKGPLQ